MFHDRLWCVAPVETPLELAEKLIRHSWTLCTGFRLGNCYFLNDSTSEDAVQEFAVVVEKDGEYRQVESITFGWCSQEKAEKHIRAAIAGELAAMNTKVDGNVLQTPEQHDRCELCA